MAHPGHGFFVRVEREVEDADGVGMPDWLRYGLIGIGVVVAVVVWLKIAWWIAKAGGWRDSGGMGSI